MTGSLGMVASTLPVQWLLPIVGWRVLFWGLAALVLVANTAIWITDSGYTAIIVAAYQPICHAN